MIDVEKIKVENYTTLKIEDGRKALFIRDLLVNPNDFMDKEKMILERFIRVTYYRVLLDKYTQFDKLPVNARVIIRNTAKLYDTPVATLFRKTRKQPGTEARQYAMTVLIRYYSQKQIMKFFNIHNHSLVVHGIEKINDLDKNNELYFQLVRRGLK